jgi:glycosyltransferase involved in cell wall biosynthesis
MQTLAQGVPALSDPAPANHNPPRPVVYDVTRLVTRALNPSPNGIDRVDFALARHFLRDQLNRNEALTCTALGPRLAPAALAAQTVAGIETYWNEFSDADADPVFNAVTAALTAAPALARPRRVSRSLGADGLVENARAIRRWALRLGRSVTEVPEGAVYFNASQFLLDKPWFLRWLDRRPDVKPVFFVHDLLPIDHPEFFRPIESLNHHGRMRNICRYAAGVIVSSRTVARRLREFAAQHGRESLPIAVTRLPVAPAFEAPAAPGPELADANYFVICGTIEPRKNHLTLLNVWRALAARGTPPKLVIAGKRGWLNENVLDMLERSADLRPHVIEAGGLSTPALRRLMTGARALLAPSFAEGFGLPLAEAMAAGVPVIASDIEVFREVGGAALDYVDPLDGLGWLAAVADYARPESPRRLDALRRLAKVKTPDAAEFFDSVDVFLSAL